MRRMFVLRGMAHAVVEQEAEVVELRRIVRKDEVEDGDEIVCVIVGRARVYAGGHEVVIEEPRLDSIVEVRKPTR